MNKFDQRFAELMQENMSSAGVLGGEMMSVFSGDSYAPDDARIPKILGAKKKKKKNKNDNSVEPIPVARRAFPETIFLTGHE